MCGIVALIAKKPYGFDSMDIELFHNLLVCNWVRGKDSTGIFGVTKQGNVEYFKEIGNPFNIFHSKEFSSFSEEISKETNILVGHNRAATKGTISDKNAHPFVEDNIILVHNGTLTNHKTLKDVEVDSHAIVHAIAENGYKKAINSLEGAYALLWYNANTKELFISRNKERPLYCIETTYLLAIASEKDMLEWLLNRNTYGFYTPEPKIAKQFVENTIYKFYYNNNKELQIEKEILKEQPFTPLLPIPITTIPANKNTTIETKPEEPSKVLFTPENIETFQEQFKCGSLVSFTFDDYLIYPKEHQHSNYTGEIHGKHFYNPDIKITCFFSDSVEKLNKLIEYDYLDAYITSVSWRNNPRTMKLTCSKPIGQTFIKPINETAPKITSEFWHLIKTTHLNKCGRCHSHIKYNSLEKSFIKLKSDGTLIIRCANCMSEYKKRGHLNNEKNNSLPI